MSDQRRRRRTGVTMADIAGMDDETYRARIAGSDTARGVAGAGGEDVAIEPAVADAFRAWLLDKSAKNIPDDDRELLWLMDPGPEHKKRLLRHARHWVDEPKNHPGVQLPSTAAVYEALYAAACGFGPIQRLIEDPEVTEITVQAANRVIVQKGGLRKKADGVVYAGGDAEVEGWIKHFAAAANQQIGPRQPTLSWDLPDGSRITVVVRPMGLGFSLRRKRERPWTFEDWITEGTLIQEMADWLIQIAQVGRLGILWAGGSGSAKSTGVGVLLPYVPEGNVMLIQESAEISANVHPSIMAMMADKGDRDGPNGLRQIAVNAMRFAPTFVVLGEVVDRAIVAAMMAVDAGTGGAMTTCHSLTAEEAYDKLQTYCQEDEGYRTSGILAIQQALARTFPVCIHMKRSIYGRVFVSKIIQVEWQWDDERHQNGRLKFVITFEGKEVPGSDEILFTAGPGLKEPIERVRAELALLAPGGSKKAGLLRHEVRQQVDELYRQAVAAADVENFEAAVHHLEAALALNERDTRISELLAEYRVRAEDQRQAWADKLGQVRQALHAAMARSDAGEGDVRRLLEKLDQMGGPPQPRAALRAEIEAWLSERSMDRRTVLDDTLTHATLPELLDWAGTLWRQGDMRGAQHFCQRALELDPGNFEAQLYLDLVQPGQPA